MYTSARVVLVVGSSAREGEGQPRVGRTKNQRNGGFVRKSICPPERVLRYPDGKVRRIRYPCLTGPTVVACPRFEERVQTSRTSAPGNAREDTVGEVGDGAAEDVAGLDLSSPLAFLRYVTSEAYTRRLEEENGVVRGTFEVHSSCPWVVPRKVWTLGVEGGRDDVRDVDDGLGSGAGRAASNVFFLRTRSPQTQVESELNSLLFSGKRRKIRCSSLVDGIVLFTEVSDAEAFAEHMLTDGGHGAVSIAEHDSHALFRHLVACRSVAVVMKARFGDALVGRGMGLRGFPERLKAVLLEWEGEEEV